MSGFWLISYIGLWVIVIVLCLLVVGLVQQVGFLRLRVDEGASGEVEDGSNEPAQGEPGVLPSLSDDGPAIGSALPKLALETFNLDQAPITPASWHHPRGTLVMFLSAVCESCQHITESLNQIVDQRIFEGRVIVILRADRGIGQGFLRIFPLHVPVVLDEDNVISMGLDVHRMPMALFYDGQGKLVRKGTPITHEGLLALIGNPTIDLAQIPDELARIHPSPIAVEQRSADEGELAQVQQ